MDCEIIANDKISKHLYDLIKEGERDRVGKKRVKIVLAEDKWFQIKLYFKFFRQFPLVLLQTYDSTYMFFEFF